MLTHCTVISSPNLVLWRLSMRCNPAIRRGSLKKPSKLVAHSVWAGPLLRNNLQRHLWEAKLAGEQSIQWVSLTGVANLSFPCSCASMVHSLQKISGRFADFLYKTAFLKSKFEDDPVRVQRHNVPHFKDLE